MRPEPEGLTLAATQSALFSLITGRETGTEPADSTTFIVGDARAGADERVAVYAFMYRARLAEALESQFPRLAKLLGAETFSELCDAYVEDHPSTHWSLRFLGARFADWLGHRFSDGILAGLAALEWARDDVFDTADEPTLSVDDLRCRPTERFAELPIRLIEAHRTIEVAAGTADLWEQIESEGANCSATAATGHESLLVWRQGVAVYHRIVETAEREALALAATGTTVGRLCELAAVAGDADQAARHAFAWIWSWANDKLLAALS